MRPCFKFTYASLSLRRALFMASGVPKAPALVTIFTPAAFPPVRRIMGMPTLMSILGSKCPCLTQIGANSALLGPYWGLEVKKGDLRQRVV